MIVPAFIESLGPVKPRYPAALALEVARELCAALKPHCEKLIVAGSLRRRKKDVGDLEILFLPKFEKLPLLKQADLLSGPAEIEYLNLADAAIESLVQKAIILQRRNTLGSFTWGPKNKLARHTSTGIPVDLFTATEANWFNYLVCRTGSADNNVRIASAAQAKGWKWHPYDSGFTNSTGEPVPVTQRARRFLPRRPPLPRTLGTII
jgi:DNA polymerase/3'-5' exonuclease PolX